MTGLDPYVAMDRTDKKTVLVSEKSEKKKIATKRDISLRNWLKLVYFLKQE